MKKFRYIFLFTILTVTISCQAFKHNAKVSSSDPDQWKPSVSDIQGCIVSERINGSWGSLSGYEDDYYLIDCDRSIQEDELMLLEEKIKDYDNSIDLSSYDAMVKCHMQYGGPYARISSYKRSLILQHRQDSSIQYDFALESKEIQPFDGELDEDDYQALCGINSGTKNSFIRPFRINKK